MTWPLYKLDKVINKVHDESLKEQCETMNIVCTAHAQSNIHKARFREREREITCTLWNVEVHHNSSSLIHVR